MNFATIHCTGVGADWWGHPRPAFQVVTSAKVDSETQRGSTTKRIRDYLLALTSHRVDGPKMKTQPFWLSHKNAPNPKKGRKSRNSGSELPAQCHPSWFCERASASDPRDEMIQRPNAQVSPHPRVSSFYPRPSRFTVNRWWKLQLGKALEGLDRVGFGFVLSCPYCGWTKSCTT